MTSRAINGQRENMLIQAWEQEAQKYAVDVQKLNSRQRAILEAAKEYFDTLKKNGVSISKNFPHEIDTYEMALAWVLKVGNNEDLLRRLFRSVVSVGHSKKVYIEHILYDPNVSIFQGFVAVHDIYDQYKKDIPATDWFEPVLAVLYYSLVCENIYKDNVREIRSKEATKRRKGSININTLFFLITVHYKDKEGQSFDWISITPTSQLRYANIN